MKIIKEIDEEQDLAILFGTISLVITVLGVYQLIQIFCLFVLKIVQ